MDEIGLQDLIYQVKRELLVQHRAQLAKDPNPLFVIDKIELEIAVKISKGTNNSIKLTVLEFGDITVGSTVARERGHVVRVSLSPLLSRDVLLADALKDPKVREAIQLDSQSAFVKSGGGLAGEPE